MAQKQSDKTVFPLSNITTWREREPTSPGIANRGLHNMAVDFSQQKSLVPSKLGSTMTGSRTMNETGRPFALDAMVGGAGEARGADRAAGPTRQKLSDKRGR